jgi:AraC-like DNA-binding protein
MSTRKPKRSRAQAQRDRETAAAERDMTELRIADSIAVLNAEDSLNVRQTAIRFSVSESTLHRRWKGQVKSHRAAAETQQLLTPAQERALVEDIIRALDMKLPYRPHHVQEQAALIVEAETGVRPTVRDRRSR